AAGERVSRSIGSVLTSRCQRSGVVERTACTSANQVVNEHLLLPDPLPEEDRNRSLSYKQILFDRSLPLTSIIPHKTDSRPLSTRCLPRDSPAFVETRNIQAITSIVHKQPG